MEYQITIKRLETIVYSETKDKYFDKKTGEETEYSYSNSENLVSKPFKTGKEYQRIETETVFEQKVDELDISKLAVFLNTK